MATLKSYDDYDIDPFSMFQQQDFDKGLAEAPLPSSAHEAIRLSVVNGHSLFRGVSGDVIDALDVLDASEVDEIDIEIPADAESPGKHPVQERVQAHRAGAALDTHDELAPSDDTEPSEPAATSASTKLGGRSDAIDSFSVEVVVDNTRVLMRIPAKTGPGDVLNMVRKKMGVTPDVRLGYWMPGDPKKSPARLLASSEDMGDAMKELLGKLKRARSRRTDMIMKVAVLDKPKVNTVLPQPKRISQYTAKKKEANEAVNNMPDVTRSTFAKLWSKYQCHAPDHDRCFVDSSVHPPVHRKLYVEHISFWAGQIGVGRATLDMPPHDMRWDSKHEKPHTSSASAGSLPTTRSPYVSKNDSGEKADLGLITIHSDTSTRSPTPGPSCSKPPLKREASASPAPLMSDRRASKRPATGATRPRLNIQEGVKYPPALDVLLQLSKAFPAHCYKNYENSLIEHQIYYAPDILVYDPDWYVANFGMGFTAAGHFYNHAEYLTERASHGGH
ncbi:hypothetical protein FRC08_004776 [Ceratobasidium sp. 394]|nr:hypothetical protein FRC08_004776 [Ceratobasidium sp. 394]KAG9096825.1 hypothetical protein FS749_007631 [Ceratobasidium sp. UAMH 11750]